MQKALLDVDDRVGAAAQMQELWIKHEASSLGVQVYGQVDAGFIALIGYRVIGHTPSAYRKMRSCELAKMLMYIPSPQNYLIPFSRLFITGCFALPPPGLFFGFLSPPFSINMVGE